MDPEFSRDALPDTVNMRPYWFVQAKTLTDGSCVYDVVGREAGCEEQVRLVCRTHIDAEKLAAHLNRYSMGFEVEENPFPFGRLQKDGTVLP